MKWNVRKLGLALVELGGGRKRKEDKIDPDVGIYHRLHSGDPVKKGEAILKVFFREKAQLQRALPVLRECYSIEEKSFPKSPLVRKVMST